jgi:uncharacterized protein (DUF2147 family)
MFTTLLLAVLMNFAPNQTEPDQIIGQWLNEEKDGRIVIYRQNNVFFGKIVWGVHQTDKDDKNPEPTLRNRERLGLVILKDFVFSKGEWTNGTIYDPSSGKTYSCKMTLKDVNTLAIRGYVGLSFLGRTTTWTRFK